MPESSSPAGFLLIVPASTQQWRNYNIVGNVCRAHPTNTKLIPSRYPADKLLLKFAHSLRRLSVFRRPEICRLRRRSRPGTMEEKKKKSYDSVLPQLLNGRRLAVEMLILLCNAARKRKLSSSP